MRTLFAVLLILGLAIVVGKLSYSEPGLLSINYQGWVVETTPVAALVAAVVAILGLLFFIKLLAVLINLPAFVKSRSRSGKHARAHKHLQKGYVELTQGHWAQAEKLLARSDHAHDTALISLLAAARAASEQGAGERRDHYLDKATEQFPQAGTVIDITRAEIQIAGGDFDKAQETLTFLRASAPRQAHVIKLLASVYRAQQDWSKLDALLPVARRRNALHAADLTKLETECWAGMIETADAARLEGYWQRLPKNAQQSPVLMTQYVTRLIALEKHIAAEKLLRDSLNKAWDESLVAMYASAELPDPSKQLNTAEAWIGNHGRSAALLLTLGQLCLRCQLWGKARVYLESSLGLEDSATASLALADLLMQLGETDHAREYYARGLKLALNKPATPISRSLTSKTEQETTEIPSQSRDLKLVEN